MSNNWRLEQYTAESFAGIDKSKGIVVVFPEGKNLVEYSGNQGAGKTSHLSILKHLFGAEPIPNAVNKTDGTISGELVIVKGDLKYVVKANKRNMVVILHQEDGTKSKIDEPKTFMQKLIGPYGDDPMDLKNKKGKDQIKWVRSLFNLTKEEQETEDKIMDSYKKSYEERTEINKQLASLKTKLADTGYYNWDKENKCFTAIPKLEEDKKIISSGAADAEAINSTLRKAQEKYNESVRCEFAMQGLNDDVAKKNIDIATIEDKIKKLQEELEVERSALANLQDRIKNGIEYNKQFIYAKDELASAQLASQRLHENKALEVGIANAQRLLVDFDMKEQESLLINGKIDETQLLIKKMIKSFTPEIDGLEIKVASVIDAEFENQAYRATHPGCTDRDAFMHVEGLKTDNVDGLFCNGRSVAEMSESELYSLCIKLWEFMGVRVVFIENITSLGSEAIDVINMFAEKGAYVFYSQMDRKQKDLKINFHNKID